MVNIAKKAVKELIRKAGFTIRRTPAEETYEFSPRPEDRFSWLRKLGIRTILDVGGHTGESALQFREILPEATIYSFEPLRSCFLELEKRLADMPNRKAFNVALGDKPGTGTIHRSSYSPSSSLLSMAESHKSAYPFSAGETSESIAVDTLDAMAERLDLRTGILLKIDTQGFEKQVLLGAADTLKSVSAIIVETSFVELYREQARFPEIYRMLEDSGFEYRGSWDQFLNPKDGTPIQQDAIFLRKG